jgi:hypothetical protein
VLSVAAGSAVVTSVTLFALSAHAAAFTAAASCCVGQHLVRFPGWSRALMYCWVALALSLGHVYLSLGDATSSRGDATSSLGGACSLAG